MNDRIIRGITRDGMIQFTAIDGRGMVSRACEIHHTTPVTSAALGRVLMAASMLGNALKGEGNSLTIQVKGGGPIGSITVVSDQLGNTRGYCQRPGIDLPLRADGKLDVSGAVGTDGYLTVIKDMGLKEPYVGQVALASGEIAEDITAYLVESEQIPSACALGVLVDTDYSIKCAGGYLIQLLPEVSEDTVARLEENLKKVRPMTAMLADHMSLEDIVRTVLDGFDAEVLEEDAVEYRCFCSEARVEQALISMGISELAKLRDEGEDAEITCQFCDKVYRFTPAQIDEWITCLQKNKAEEQ